MYQCILMCAIFKIKAGKHISGKIPLSTLCVYFFLKFVGAFDVLNMFF